ncbi:hypothetical protein PG997_004560 [Apiospora hydei]|uniref:Uncharacterized protein n=1 Tax=Apiospora hydei TaxID=1337664 RepID=A0ABR1X2P0_9PEZI
MAHGASAGLWGADFALLWGRGRVNGTVLTPPPSGLKPPPKSCEGTLWRGSIDPSVWFEWDGVVAAAALLLVSHTCITVHTPTTDHTSQVLQIPHRPPAALAPAAPNSDAQTYFRRRAEGNLNMPETLLWPNLTLPGSCNTRSRARRHNRQYHTGLHQ